MALTFTALIVGSLILLAMCVRHVRHHCEVTDPAEKRAAALRAYSDVEG